MRFATRYSVLALLGFPAAQAEPLVLQLVPAGDIQSGGPSHSFRIGLSEVTNARFAEFLNDALANLDNERGQYLYHHTPSSSVYVNTIANGQVGDAPLTTFVFNEGVGVRISFASGSYVVAAGYEDHPVVGVTWYGALKFCNWLTLNEGLGPAERCYVEATASELDLWRPVTIAAADWAVRDLNAVERAALVLMLGYRLPMDDGAGPASPYNEWYKSCAFNPGHPDADAAGNVKYGFGREPIVGPDAISGADANYTCSGDEFEGSPCTLGATTPAAYYNGTLQDVIAGPPAFQTNDTENRYGLYDASGNVWEWTQDQAQGGTQRAIRGGSWNSSTSSLRCTVRSQLSPTSATATAGFRVLQSLPTNLLVTPTTGAAAEGPFGGPYVGTLPAAYSVQNVSGAVLPYAIVVEAAWISLSVTDASGAAAPSSGDLSADASLSVAVAIEARGLLVDPNVALGDNTATLTISDVSNPGEPTNFERVLTLTLTEPLSVSPEGVYLPLAIVGQPVVPATQSYTLTNAAQAPMAFSVASSAPWLTLDTTSGTVPGGGSTTIVASVAPMGLGLGLHTGDVTVTNAATGTTFEREVVLLVSSPMTVAPADGLMFTGAAGGPFTADGASFTLQSTVTTAVVNWTAAADKPWVQISPAAGELAAAGQAQVAISIDATATDLLPQGRHDAMATFFEANNLTVALATRTITVEVTGLSIAPATDFLTSGPESGPFTPAQLVYTLTSQAAGELEWEARTDVAWLSINGQACSGGLAGPPCDSGVIIVSGGMTPIAVGLNAAANALPLDSYSGTVEVRDPASGTSAVRYVSLNVTNDQFDVPMSIVTAADNQPGGPTYNFRMGTREVTNGEFVTFLNSARVHALDPLGEHMAFDLETGNVRVGSSAGPLMFDASDGAAISFDGTRYLVAAANADKPVVGVSWYGAVKFCNWLTLIQAGRTGVPARAYHEGPQPGDWYPITASSAASDLTPIQRALLLAYAGYRLPMDGGVADAAAYNEWYKAAAWDQASQSNQLYGFGRDTITPADANYLGSNDPYEDPLHGETPVAFYDGGTHSGFVTAANANDYGLFDLSGNVDEWVQDFGDAAATRAARGGHWSAPAGLSSNTSRASYATDSTWRFTGFRAVQATQSIPPLAVTPAGPLTATHVVGDAYSPMNFVLELAALGLVAQPWTANSDVDWLTINGSSSAAGVCSPAQPMQVVIAFAPAADALPLDADPRTPGNDPHIGTITISDLASGATTTRQVLLTVSDALTVAPAGDFETSGLFGGPFTPPQAIYTLDNLATAARDWEVTSSETWLTINGAASATGTLAPGGSTDVTVALAEAAAALPIQLDPEGVPQPRTAILTFEDLTSGQETTRMVALTVDPPVTVTPAMLEFSGPVGGPFVPLSPGADVLNIAAAAGLTVSPLSYTVSANQPWLSLNGTTSLSGDLNPPSAVDVTVTVNGAANGVGIADHTATVTLSDATWGSITQSVVLHVTDGLSVAPTTGLVSTGPAGGPFAPPAQLYTLTNQLTTVPINWTATVDQPWIKLNGQATAAGLLLPGSSIALDVAIDPATAPVLDGSYAALVACTNTNTGQSSTRSVELTVGQAMTVLPLAGVDALGRTGWGLTPSTATYTIHNIDTVTLQWEAVQAAGGPAWLSLDGAVAAGGSLAPGESIIVTVSIDRAQTDALPAGVHFAAVEFHNLSSGIGNALRGVTLTISDPFAVDAPTVSGAAAQPDGPTYAFTIGRYEVTNAEFAEFLNNALANPMHPRGQFMFHATDVGTVYVHSAQDGASGADTGGTLMFTAAASQISFVAGAYRVAAGTEGFPVTGVSWYGAVKFCNWLTLDQGLPAGEQCYGEGASAELGAWRPKTITAADWAARDLNDAERLALVENYRGYRLPMDDGANNATPSIDAADAYDEWYKAAAWNPALNANTTYGFGRNAFSGADANYQNSGDPFDNGPTPVGYYDGSDHGGAFPTNPNENGFGVYDLSGNVWEWVQDRNTNTSNTARAIRGGSWANFAQQACWMEVVDRCPTPPATANNQLGFRITRVPAALGGPDADGDGDVDLTDLRQLFVCFSGSGDPPPPTCTFVDLDEDGDVDLSDYALAAFALTGP